MNLERKGQSPFYPGQPVPVEFFVGRAAEVSRIRRAAYQVAGGKPQAVFISGDYGIGKSSLARYMRVLSQDEVDLIGFHVMLGGTESLEAMTQKTVEKIIAEASPKFPAGKAVRELLGKYIKDVSISGVTLNTDQLLRDIPDLSRGFLPFLREVNHKIENDCKGIVLILDEINGIALTPAFAQFLKGLVDENSLSDKPVPLLLILCGTDERYRQIVSNHRPVERIFDIAKIDPMSLEEMREFYSKTFEKVSIKVEPTAMDYFCHYSGGLPKLMHLIGDAAFWKVNDDNIDKDLAIAAILEAAEDVGRKFIDQQVMEALKSKDYKSILKKLGKQELTLEFKKADIAQGLNETEKNKFNNFLQRMKKLGVLNSGERGEYIFRDWLTRIYIMMIADKGISK